MSPKQNPGKPIAQAVAGDLKSAINEEADDFIDDIREELVEARNNLITELKETLMGLLNSIFGDFNLFWSVIKTIAVWFIKPATLNVRQVEAENLERKRNDEKPRYFTDIGLMKSIFMLSLTFLVIEEAAGLAETADSISNEKWLSQAGFLLFFVALLFVFIGVMWFWKLLVGVPVKDTRVFVGFLIYQNAAIYIISFIMSGPLGIDYLSEEDSNGLVLVVYFVPLLQSLYFLFRMMSYYQLSTVKKVWGFVLGAAILAAVLFLPGALTHTFMT